MDERRSLRDSLKKVPGATALSGGTDRMIAAQQDRLDSMQRLLDSHEQSLRSLTIAVNALENHLPNLLNTIASGHGAQRQIRRDLNAVQEGLQQQINTVWAQMSAGPEASIAQLWERLEMVRKELLFELRYLESGRGGPDQSQSSSRADDAPSPKIVDGERVERFVESGIRLNLGCGHVASPDHLNVDMRELPGVDIVAAVDDLPFQDGSVQEIFSSHVLEHFPIEELRRRLLPYWFAKLAPGGTFRAIVPDAAAMIRRHHSGEIPFDQFREVFFGGQEYEGDFHHNMFTPDSLAALLVDGGLVAPLVEAEDRRNGSCFEFQISATKPG